MTKTRAIKQLGRAAAGALAIGSGGIVEAQEPRRSVAPKAMHDNAPALATYTDEVLFGDVWRRPGLALRDRSLVTLTVLIATGRTGQMEGHLARGLDNGLTPIEVSGLVTHLAFYAGWPSSVSALEVVDRVFRARNIPQPVARSDVKIPLPASDAARRRSLEQEVAPFAPKLAALTNEVLFRDLWTRSELAPRDRSLATIAALAASGDADSGDADQLPFHLQLGVDNGLTSEQIGEALTHLAFYAGWPKAMAGVAVSKKTFATASSGPEAINPLAVVQPDANAVPRPAPNFTGNVSVTSPFQATGEARLGGATVMFARGARSNWHEHPLGQLLIIREGAGWVQAEGEPVRLVKAGDVVWTAPGVKHWHGATRTSTMSHVAVSEMRNGDTVTWLGPVSDAEFRGPS
ncbi:4-carboxymuconolactone decarboxylase [Sphingobium xanthum]|uniref:(R)-mandelonitrile lyase n=1 Tax=Sphingobium xanthum TaxID=1387165 RepID=UPI001FE9A7F4|nr:carboxymuconolactone decarboxylase family protein [Sphingobium xanthum]